MNKCILGIDIGKTNIRAAISEGTPELKYYCKQPYRSSTPQEFEDQLVAAIGRALEESGYSRDTITAIGIDVRRTQWTAFVLAGSFAGLAGGIYAFSKGSISPETLAIPRSVDALVMVLLGGLNALAGPLIGAAAFTWLSDTLARATEYWRAVLGATILIIVIAFPMGIGGTISHWLRRRAI